MLSDKKLWPVNVINRTYELLKRAVRDAQLLHYYRTRLFGISSHLEPGIYIIAPRRRTMFRNDDIAIDYLKSTFGFVFETCHEKNIFIRTFLSMIYKVKISNTNPSFWGQLVIFSNKLQRDKRYGELRVFDLKRKTCLRAYNTKESYKKSRQDAEYFNNHFKIPTVLIQNDAELYTVEKLVDFIPPKHLSSKDLLTIMRNLFHSYTAYYRKVYKKSEFESLQPCSLFEYNKLHSKGRKHIDYIRSSISASVLSMKLPVVYQHGDLSLSNILLTKANTFYIIDWEHAAHFSILYDIMWFWQNEAIHRDNYYLIKYYLAGGFDTCMTDLFGSFELNYRKEFRLDYFIIMIMEFIRRRVSIGESLESDAFFYKKIIPMVKNACNIV